jgi:hypothetical protein
MNSKVGAGVVASYLRELVQSTHARIPDLYRGYVLSGMVQDLDEGDPEMFYSKKLP